MALVSFILGAILAAKGRTGVGATIMVLSLFMLLAWVYVASTAFAP